MTERVPSQDYLSLPHSSSSSALHRQTSSSSSRSGSGSGSGSTSINTKKNGITPTNNGSAPSSGSVSKATSFMSTPRLLSRRNSSRDTTRPGNGQGGGNGGGGAGSYLIRKLSGKGKGKAREVDLHLDEPLPLPGVGAIGTVHGHGHGTEVDDVESNVIETPSLHIDRDPSTGRKMINQYLVLQEIGHGTHGRVRLGRDMSSETEPLPSMEEGEEEVVPDNGNGTYYAIKIVDRNPKRKRLAGFNRNRGKNDGGKLIHEIEIRKEIAIFKKVNHPNVVRMKEIIDDPDSSKLFMILEYCDGGELRWKDQFGQPYLSLDETRQIFRDTLLGLAYLHHQGIIHRDIKPSNLLFSGNGIVKISDFGCSHYSEALRTASAQAGPEGEEYVDDIELAKTAGSPAFFAPEMCYTGLETELSPRSSRSPQGTPSQELPAFTLRPPSLISEMGEPRGGLQESVGMSPGGRTFPLAPTTSNDSGLSRRPPTSRTRSSVTVQRQPRHPITNAIDVWALGVTLYCLLFGKTPFDAPNEYLLMQIIPTADYEVPPTLGSDKLATVNGSLEVQDCLDLMRRLLEKDPTKRITLEQAKKHPFTLTGIDDPSSWLASTDPHAETFVTVSNDEVAAAVTKSSSFRDKFRKGIKSISHKLQIFSSTRNRSRSIGAGAGTGGNELDSGNTSASGKSSTTASQTNIAGNRREVSPITSPNPGNGSVPRRFSAFGPRPEIPSPRRSSAQLHHTASPLHAPEMSTRSVSSQSQGQAAQKGFVVHRPTTHLPTPAHKSTNLITQVDPKRPTPRSTASTGSLDQLRGVDTSPRGPLRRRESEDSNTSSGFGHRFIRILSGTSRSRSRNHITSDTDESATGTGTGNGALAPRSIEATSTAGGESIGRPSIDSVSTGPHPTLWPHRDREHPIYTRRGSTLSEDLFQAPLQEESDVKDRDKNQERERERDDVDWDAEVSDEDDYADTTNINININTSPNLNHGVEPHQPVSIAPNLAPIPDISPILIASPPRHSSPRGERYQPHSPSSWSRNHDRARSPLAHFRQQQQLQQQQQQEVVDMTADADEGEDEGLAYVSKRTRKDSMLSSVSGA